jgi:biofilm PGA synthesis N-glycosyltransferase PgaC
LQVSDATALIVDEAARRYPWIEAHHLPAGRPRAPGGESVIMRFLPADTWSRTDFILRLDADISFAPNFVELLLEEFARDPRLGIGSCVLMEMHRGRWHEVHGPSFHTRGAVKMYSRACFAAIGGLYGGLGWDTLDEVRAMMKGFITRSFDHIIVRPALPVAAGAARWLPAALLTKWDMLRCLCWREQHVAASVGRGLSMGR